MSTAWSIGKAKKNTLEKTDALSNPGPGHYESQTSISTAPKYKFGKAKRDVSMEGNKSNPGPGHYEKTNIFPNTPKCTMGKKLESTNIKEMSNLPGPGNYEPNFDINCRSSSAYTIAQRPKTERETPNQPGPGEYEIKNTFDRKSCKVRFGKSERENISKQINSPGPGFYEITIGFGKEEPKYSFGKAKKGSKNEFELTPGPGNYEEKRIFGNGPKISISFSRPESAKISNTPGPGQYESHRQIANTASIKFGKGKRDYDPISKEKATIPGPCQYTPKIMDKSSTTYVSFGKSKRNEVNNSEKFPGPGHYSNNFKLGEGVPKFSMRSKPKIQKDEVKVPGPGHYHTENLYHQVRAKSPSWKIGTTKKNDAYKEVERRGVPGPGMYENLPLESGPSIKFGKDIRKEREKNDTPGPGSYRIPCSFRDVPRYISSTGNFEENYRYI